MRNAAHVFLFLNLYLLLTCLHSLAQSYSTSSQGLYAYTTADAGPNSSLIIGNDGAFYGVSDGAIYRVFPYFEGFDTTAGDIGIKQLHIVQGGTDDGQYSSLVQATDGNFYGISPTGGTGYGEIFQLTPEGRFTSVYSFCSLENCADGLNPDGALIEGTDGALWGTTRGGVVQGSGNIINSGTVFRLSASGALTTVYTFCAKDECKDGSAPDGPLVQASDGNFYGVTGFGGANEYGTVFQLTPAGKLTTLHSFCSESNCADGQFPFGSLAQGGDLRLYGITGLSGSSPQVAYAVDLSGNFTVLNSMCEQGSLNCPSGSWDVVSVFGRPFVAGNGVAYVSASGGGADGTGAVWGLNGADYNGSLGLNGVGFGTLSNGVVQDGSGAFWGYAASGGYGYGGIYSDIAETITSGGSALNAAPALTLSAAPVNFLTGESSALSWQSPAAVSKTMQQCFGSVNGKVMSSAPPTGQYKFTPASAGTYTVSVTCGGTVSAFQQLTVTGSLTPTITNFQSEVFPDGLIIGFVTVAKRDVPGHATGTVSVLINGTPVKTGQLQAPGTAFLDGSISGLAQGNYTLDATYNGDPGDETSTSPASALTIGPGAEFAVLPYPEQLYSSTTHELVAVELDYIVNSNKSGTPAPTGTVTFQAGSTTLCVVAMNNGSAGCEYPTPSGSFPGVTVSASYSGDTKYAPIQSSLKFQPEGLETSMLRKVMKEAAEKRAASFKGATSAPRP